MATGFVYHPDYLMHQTGPMHAEIPQRLESLISHLEKTGLRKSLVGIDPAPAELCWVQEIHEPSHIEYVRSIVHRAPAFLDPDTAVSHQSYEVALLAAGGAMALISVSVSRCTSNSWIMPSPKKANWRP